MDYEQKIFPATPTQKAVNLILSLEAALFYLLFAGVGVVSGLGVALRRPAVSKWDH